MQRQQCCGIFSQAQGPDFAVPSTGPAECMGSIPVWEEVTEALRKK